jgi:RsiW-degrading membrane proteinase PrsW (M82 family)
MDYSIALYILFGILPSLIWLSYYLTKDLHPEPKRMILKIFFWGALITLPVFFVQIGLTYLLNKINLSSSMGSMTYSVIYWFLIIAFSEEFFKYLVVKAKVVNSPHLDEPIDVMLYMIVAALGFAAIENVLYLFAPVGQLSFSQLLDRTMIIDLVRFIGATFLHTLCSGVIGYLLAMSFYETKRRHLYVALGVIAAVGLHGLYDFSIMTLGGYIKFAIPVIIIITLAFLVFSGFEKLKKMKGICKIQ